MSPFINAKAYAIQATNLTNFGEFSLAIYYEVMKHAANYERVDLVFDRYFEGSLKEGTRMGRGQAPVYLFEGDFTELPFKMAEHFLRNSENKHKLNEYLAKKKNYWNYTKVIRRLLLHIKTPPLFLNHPVQSWINTYQFDHMKLKKLIKD